MTARRSPILRLLLVLGVLAFSAVALLVAVVIVAVIVTSDGGDDDAAGPQAPADICAVVGTDDLAAWVPGATAVESSADASEATCEVSTAEDEPYQQLTASVSRWSDTRSLSAEHQAEDWYDLHCGDDAEDLADLGDAACIDSAESRAEVTVRRGGDIVRVSHYSDPLTDAEARERVVTVATRLLAALD